MLQSDYTGTHYMAVLELALLLEAAVPHTPAVARPHTADTDYNSYKSAGLVAVDYCNRSSVALEADAVVRAHNGAAADKLDNCNYTALVVGEVVAAAGLHTTSYRTVDVGLDMYRVVVEAPDTGLLHNYNCNIDCTPGDFPLSVDVPTLPADSHNRVAVVVVTALVVVQTHR